MDQATGGSTCVGHYLWRSLEQYHREFFRTPLPLIPEAEAERPQGEISPLRVRHLLWVLYPQVIPDLILAPEHVDLLRVSDVVAGFLRAQFADLPRDSGIKQFLGTPDGYGWEGFFGLKPTPQLEEATRHYRYDAIFVLDPLDTFEDPDDIVWAKDREIRRVHELIVQGYYDAG